MKKIGILFGQENTFPQAFIDRINEKKINGIMAEAVMIDKVMQADPTEYAVIIDRISQDVPFYRAYLKNAAISGTAVLNNPFWWSADEKFFNNALAIKTGVPVPKTVLLPSKDRPDDTTENSFRNLKYPMDWDGIFEHIGFPAYMKPFAGGGWKNVYKLNNADEFFKNHSETGQLIMMLQEEIVFNEYFRCYCLGGNEVRIMQYEPRNPHHLRYVHDGPPLSKKLLDTVKDYTIKLNAALGYDFNTVEFAVRDGIPYAIDFCNPAPDADINSVGQENFEWVVETAANMAIKRAQEHKPGQMNLTWGTFVKNAVAPTTKKPAAKKAPAKKAAPAIKTPVTKKAQTKAKTLAATAPAVKKAPAKAVATKAKKATPAKTTTGKKTTAAKKTSITKVKATTATTKKPVKKATTTKSKSK
ncbi:hypothetical protein [Arenibacter sp. S6351L]|uniref:ATP-grasp domain-containing protein n=1 Tax=Arenibacter sp. S6351L TaxID=2926407 RepID=UPI001FF2A393|nr:hypothetical protein [Arenibacter sp. S6351L]MCK0132820.1 hypothetical protein [Arenibacter sp. S6351L]